MKRALFLFLLVGLILVACSPQSTPSTINLDPTQNTQTQPEATSAITSTAETPVETQDVPMPTATPVEDASTSSNIGTYQIIGAESQVSYEVGETFFNENNRFATAIGVTSEISGEITLDSNNPQNTQIGEIRVDISQFRSDSSRRDGAIRDRFLESGRYPIATFVPTEIAGLPETYAPGETLTFQVTGDLTIRETTLPVTFDVTAKLDGDTLSGTAETTILMSDFGIGPITIAGILGTEDTIKLTFNFVARP
jgi:polyisoprenoid-binding protein YceI